MKKNQHMWSCHLNFALKLDEEKSKTCGLVHLNFALKLDEENSKHVVFSPQFCTEIG